MAFHGVVDVPYGVAWMASEHQVKDEDGVEKHLMKVSHARELHEEGKALTLLHATKCRK